MILLIEWDDNLFEEKGQRFLEIASEALHLAISIFLQQYIDPKNGAKPEPGFLFTIATLFIVH